MTTTKSHLSFYDPPSVHSGGGISLTRYNPPSRSCCCDSLTSDLFHCPDQELTPFSSSSRQMFLYSYEIFLVLSAIYFTYTVLKLPSDAQLFLLAPTTEFVLSTQGNLKQNKRNVLFFKNIKINVFFFFQTSALASFNCSTRAGIKCTSSLLLLVRGGRGGTA